jgi:hypothetical protein
MDQKNHPENCDRFSTFITALRTERAMSDGISRVSDLSRFQSCTDAIRTDAKDARNYSRLRAFVSTLRAEQRRPYMERHE